MRTFFDVFAASLRRMHDTERQLQASLSCLQTGELMPGLTELTLELQTQADVHIDRLLEIFFKIDLAQTAESSWPATALLRQAWEATAYGCDMETRSRGCAAALFELKHLQKSEYEIVVHWANSIELRNAVRHLEQCARDEDFQAQRLRHFVTLPNGMLITTNQRNFAILN
jgi:ferritin-like metal-binding protein YciE